MGHETPVGDRESDPAHFWPSPVRKCSQSCRPSIPKFGSKRSLFLKTYRNSTGTRTSFGSRKRLRLRRHSRPPHWTAAYLQTHSARPSGPITDLNCEGETQSFFSWRFSNL